MNIIGREKETGLLRDILGSKRPELLVVYGRRRVGKTYLIREYFNDRFSFYATGVPNEKMANQLKVFHMHLMEYGSKEKRIPKDWLEAFGRLRELLESENIYRHPVDGRRVIFLDELPWMDTARSDFKMALDHFWNSYACVCEDILMIVCGSAASWLIDNMFTDTGGFYNRVTRRMLLLPFSLYECERLLRQILPTITKNEVMDYYMVFGGIPFYLNMFDSRLSVAQNIDSLIFVENAPLAGEYELLFRTLFKNTDQFLSVIEELSKKNVGVTRQELIKTGKVVSGNSLTKVLMQLEQCRFIRKYRDYSMTSNGSIYQIIDPFVLFYNRVIKRKKIMSWMEFINTPGYYAWRGNSFEILCLNHIGQIKRALGVSGVSSMEYAWKSKKSKPGAQIDMLMDRKDDVINVCEMKYSDGEYVIDGKYAKELIYKMEVFRKESNTKKALRMTMISANGVAENEYRNLLQNVVMGEELFAK